jgi:hypothetical protein
MIAASEGDGNKSSVTGGEEFISQLTLVFPITPGEPAIEFTGTNIKSTKWLILRSR